MSDAIERTWDRHTDRAKRVITLAREAAGELRHDSIEADHLLLGLLREGTGVAIGVLNELPGGSRALLDRIGLEPGSSTTAADQLRFGESAERVFREASAESTALKSGYIGTEHLLIGLLAAGGRPATILDDAGLELSAARDEVLQFIGGPAPDFVVQRIVSGGQTGVDRAALDVAIDNGIEHGGWCPRGRLAEDGRIPERYALQETDSANYSVRTEKNVVDSDATLIITRGEPTGGTALTIELCNKHGKPHLVLDLDEEPHLLIREAGEWLRTTSPETLNVAGPRESGAPGIGRRAAIVLGQALMGARR